MEVPARTGSTRWYEHTVVFTLNILLNFSVDYKKTIYVLYTDLPSSISKSMQLCNLNYVVLTLKGNFIFVSHILFALLLFSWTYIWVLFWIFIWISNKSSDIKLMATHIESWMSLKKLFNDDILMYELLSFWTIKLFLFKCYFQVNEIIIFASSKFLNWCWWIYVSWPGSNFSPLR